MHCLYFSNPYAVEKHSHITDRDTDHLFRTTPVTGEEAELKVKVDGLLTVSTTLQVTPGTPFIAPDFWLNLFTHHQVA